MKLIEAEKVKRAMKDYWKAQVDKALALTFTDCNEANKRINSYLEHNHDLLKAIDELPSAEPEAISRWKNEFKEYVDSLDITRDDWKGIIEYIDELPSAEPYTTTHDSIPAKTGKNDADKTSGDCISRQQAIDALKEKVFHNLSDEFYGAMQVLDELPSAQPEQHEIGYSECANAMLKMWIDNVLTDGEYNRIMDKLNAHWAERREDG